MVGPTISIVTPSFNQGRYIESTICSILDQRYPHLEYIVMDGGSADGSVDIIRKYEGQLSYWASERDRGQADAIARGFERATGDILAYVNSDDMLAPGSLARVAAAFQEDPCAGVIYGARTIVDEEGRKVGEYHPPTVLSIGYFAVGQWIPQEASFWRRAAYEAAGGLDASLQFCLDFDLFVRMWRHARFKRLPETLGVLRVHGESKTQRIASIMAKEASAIRVNRGVWEVHWPWLRRALEHSIYGQARLEELIRRLLARRNLAK